MTRRLLRFGVGGPIPEVPPAASRVEPLPVLLVHGILGQEVFYWNFLRRRLEAGGLDVREVTLPNLALGDLRAAADAFAIRFDQWREENQQQQVDIVAHSAGGLVLRWYLKHGGHPEHIRRLITLGTPHAGTRLTNLLPEVGMVGQVRPDSSFLAALNDADPVPPPTQYTAFWTPFDGVVVPAQSARLPFAANAENILYPGITHWGYLFGKRMARVLVDELLGGFQGGERRIGRAPPLAPPA